MANSFLSKEKAKQINTAAKNLFAHHKNAEKIYATIDGNLFFENSLNAAKNHARQIGQAELIELNKGEKVEGVDNPVQPLTLQDVRRKEELLQKANQKAAKEAAEAKRAEAAEKEAKLKEEKIAAAKKAAEDKAAAATASNEAIQEKAEQDRIAKEEAEAAELAELQKREEEANVVAKAAEEGETGGQGAADDVTHNAASVEALFADGKTEEAATAYDTLSKTQQNKVSKETKKALGK